MAFAKYLALLFVFQSHGGFVGAEMTWDEAHAKARTTLSIMTRAEKQKLMRGIGWEKSGAWFDLKEGWYVGNTAPIEHLGLPSLNMQDASNGFRTYWDFVVDTVTAWPSMMCLAATWDPFLVNLVAQSIAEEFTGKGANVLLGPGVNVQRVARNGRNFEYISGEDPYLGSQLAKAYISGVQSKNVMAVAKHWAFNSQETRRDDGSSEVDEKTAYELYYPPFQASVEAGVGSFMCSYNKINGFYACQNKKQLDILKKRFGFRGFVQSDWWATHRGTSLESALEAGLDQEMPGCGPADEFTILDEEKLDHIDDAAGRVLASIYKLNLTETTKCAPPHCLDFFKANVTSEAHVQMARRVAAESVVLLRNKGDVLPVTRAKYPRIAIIGAVANASAFNPNGAGQGTATTWNIGDYYAGGGSGHLTTNHAISALTGVSKRASELGIEVVSSPTDDIDDAISTAEEADVALIFVGTTSGEAKDRKNLELDGNASQLISEVVSKSKNKNIVVVMQIPGAVVMPWKGSVSSILALFLGGQETGNALADVLFGDHPPSGRLPFTMPETEADCIAPEDEDNVVYSEGLETGYRNKKFAAAFPFGHGLTYTSFRYSNLQVGSCEPDTTTVACLKLKVTNVGNLPGLTVPQLYLELPAAAGYPSAVLKGFAKTSELKPGSSQDVIFHITPRDVSYYDISSHDYVQVDTATAYVGESFKDIRLNARLNFPVKGSFMNVGSEFETILP
jgi:beta-glucosidase